MARINIFRNSFIDAQVGYLVDSMVDARRKETEAYWTQEIVRRIKTRLASEICPNTSDDLCDHLCSGIALALYIIDNEFDGGTNEQNPYHL